MWKALLAMGVMVLLLAASASASLRPNPINEYRMSPGPKTYSTAAPHQWVKGFTAPGHSSYLDRRK